MNDPQAWISAHLDGGLDDDGQRRFEAWLAEDDANRRRFLFAVMDHRALQQRLAGAPATGSARQRSAAASASGRRRSRPARRASRPWPARLAIAAALLVAATVGWRLARTEAPPSAAPPVALTPVPAAAPAPLPSLVAHDRLRVLRAGAPLAAPWELRIDDVLVVEAGGSAHLRYADGTDLRLPSAGEARLAGDGPGPRIVVAHGRLELAVRPQPPGRPLVVASRAAEVTVLGTTLSVAVDGDETRVAVASGRVSVARAGDRIAVAAGEYALAAVGLPLVARPQAAPVGRVLAVGPGQAHASLADLPAPLPGDVIELHPGTHRGGWAAQGAGTALRPIVVRGVGAAPALLSGTGVALDGAGGAAHALLDLRGGHWVVENLSFTGARNGATAAAIRARGVRGLVVSACRIEACDEGVVAAGDDLRIEDCDIGGCGSPGNVGHSHNIRLSGGRALVRGCSSHDAAYGVALWSACGSLVLEANRFLRSADGEISIADDPAASAMGAPGDVLLVGNLLHSGVRTGNVRRFIAVVRDPARRPGGTLHLRNNTLVAGDGRVVLVDASASGMRILAERNVMAGTDLLVAPGPGGVAGHGNLLPPTATPPPGLDGSLALVPRFADAAAGDFRLAARPPGAGVGPPSAVAVTLQPALDGAGTRPRLRPEDPGAFDVAP